jgi:hypothetical protein
MNVRTYVRTYMCVCAFVWGEHLPKISAHEHVYLYAHVCLYVHERICLSSITGLRGWGALHSHSEDDLDPVQDWIRDPILIHTTFCVHTQVLCMRVHAWCVCVCVCVCWVYVNECMFTYTKLFRVYIHKQAFFVFLKKQRKEDHGPE